MRESYQIFMGINFIMMSAPRKCEFQAREARAFLLRDGALVYQCYCLVKGYFPVVDSLRRGQPVTIKARVVPNSRKHPDMFLDVDFVSCSGVAQDVPEPTEHLQELKELEI